MSTIQIFSEIGKLEGVILHPPGPEVENMTPVNAERALYSDILNLDIARREYNQLECTLQQITNTYRVSDLLKDILQQEPIRREIVEETCKNEGDPGLLRFLLDREPDALCSMLIQGIPLEKNSLTSFMSSENFALRPLHNYFFTRDSAMGIHNNILIGNMASKVRDREALIMNAIFRHHPLLKTDTVMAEKTDPSGAPLTIEGGDVLVVREDILLVGFGVRTSTQGVDFIMKMLQQENLPQHIIVQQLPQTPESFIHLDMVFTMLDVNSCMVYAPLILQPNKYETVHIELDNGKVKSIRTVENIPTILKKLGMDLEPVYCGGEKESMTQEREQWHSGANFFAFAPGKIIGYNRNTHTLDHLSRHGFEVVRARDFLSGKHPLREEQRCVLTIDGSELSRGGGGARCMTMPFRRKRL